MQSFVIDDLINHAQENFDLIENQLVYSRNNLKKINHLPKRRGFKSTTVNTLTEVVWRFIQESLFSNAGLIDKPVY